MYLFVLSFKKRLGPNDRPLVEDRLLFNVARMMCKALPLVLPSLLAALVHRLRRSDAHPPDSCISRSVRCKLPVQQISLRHLQL